MESITNNRNRVLIAEDEEVIVRLWQALLGEQYALTIEDTGENALQHSQKSRYDLLITDYGLEANMNGLDLIASIRSHPGPNLSFRLKCLYRAILIYSFFSSTFAAGFG